VAWFRETSGRKIRSSRGLTLVEVMVTIALAGMVVVGVYKLYGVTIGSFRIESQFLDMQERLRFGLEHLKRDLRRAGFLASPNALRDPNVCAPAPNALAVALEPGTGYVFDASSNSNLQPTSLTLFGDFFSGQVYRSAGVDGARVYLQSTANFPNELEFNRIFNDDHYLRIVTQDQFEILLPIESADFTQSMIVLNQTVPRAGGGSLCGISGFGEGLEVSVAGFVRYRIARDDRPNAPSSGAKSDLIREVLSVNGSTVVSQLVIADYGIDLQFYDFALDQDVTGSSPDIVYNAPTVGQVTGAGLFSLKNDHTGSPEDLRALTVKLTVRTPDEDQDFSFRERENIYSPIESFELDTDMRGSARTLSLACRVGLTSLAARNMK
jgi:prepilin-type N-terminal cleavage/methylation domain-containing protein